MVRQVGATVPNDDHTFGKNFKSQLDGRSAVAVAKIARSISPEDGTSSWIWSNVSLERRWSKADRNKFPLAMRCLLLGESLRWGSGRLWAVHSTAIEQPGAMQILGVTCNLKSNRARMALRRVLKQVRTKSPKDFRRLQQFLFCIEGKTWTDGTLGEIWIIPDRNMFHVLGHFQKKVYVSEKLNDWLLVAILAHELGHVCTRKPQDIKHRKNSTEEWENEAAADRYACKWGFDRLIARFAKIRDYRHHGPLRVRLRKRAQD